MISALLWIERLIAVALLLQTVEFLLIRKSFSDQGVWRWRDIRQEFVFLPQAFRAALDIFLGYRGFLVLLLLRGVAALWLFIDAGSAFSGPVVLFLLAGTLLINLRWRGTFNGGSDSMTFVVLVGLSIARFSTGHPSLMKVALAWIAVQLVLSYCVSGWVKLKEAEWRRGRALGVFLARANYDVPSGIRAYAQRNPRAVAVASWGVMAFECVFPLALLDQRICIAFLGLSFFFHVANGVVFGLNRFLFAWLSAYPALVFISSISQSLSDK